MDKKRAALHNLGCKVNAYEMEKMAGKLISDGFVIVPFEEEADYYIVNTCSVTNISDRKSRQMLHRAKTANPNAVVIAAGCYVDTRGKEELYADNVDIAVPNSEKERITEIIRAWEEAHAESGQATAEKPVAGSVVAEDFPFSGNTDSFSRGRGQSEHKPGEGGYSRKFLKVQDGCNMFCSYCIIPYARGRIKSRSIKEVTEEAEAFISRGFREFVLTGIHLSSYGKDRPGDKEDLLSLITALDALPEVKRIRLGSLEPGIITDDFVTGLRKIPSLCPHFHLSLQSGSDSVLTRMNRHYTADSYAESVERLRSCFDDPALTTDVIVGFPGETEKEFEETREFLKKTGFYETHIFPFSGRKGTPAERMEGQIKRSVKHERLRILKELDLINRKVYEDRHRGKEAEVLFEEDGTGYTREYIRVKNDGDAPYSGRIMTGIIGDRREDGLMGFSADKAD
ncbi:MAG: tRNA (N(6)-L-threonylcarbamoyladenosine(37)-C(2))-methylthiotransferase MtaB [Lachnospiraceae bacterium]|nr:tRNA (N(6)-L-threonylcarbamoyladenosine(37)-C(2))-methylthiotransferase MtaB [Lachnospiraceae bacterium]